jgi:glycine/D-amino acid oxidase-like deaminating enzyme
MKIAILGNGVIGLTTGIKLLEQGRDVVIYSKDPLHLDENKSVSLVACALWQPYKLFNNLEALEKDQFSAIENISLDSLNEFDKVLQKQGPEESGIFIKRHYEYSTDSIYHPSGSLKADFYYIELLKKFWAERGDYNSVLDEMSVENPLVFMEKNGHVIESSFKFLHGYKTYVIDPSIFLFYLSKRFKQLGGEVIEKELNLNEIKKLKEKVIFNCCGSNGFNFSNNKTNLTPRKMFPKKGVLMLYKIDPENNYPNSIVLDELTILSRKNELTVGTGEIKENESPAVLIDRLQKHAIQFASAKNISKFDFDEFLQSQKIDLKKPDKILVGARPYIPDGKGYVLNKEKSQSSSRPFVLYNNFGHGGSGVTLCWGSANKITQLYLLGVKQILNSLNEYRNHKLVADFNIEIAHFDIKKLKSLSKKEIEELVFSEERKLKSLFNTLDLSNRKFSILVLIDDKEIGNDKLVLKEFLSALSLIKVDYIAYESKLVSYLAKLEKNLPLNIAKEFTRKLENNHKLACSQDIFVWYSLRFGIVDFNFEDEVIVAFSDKAKSGECPFVANSLISILDKDLDTYEDKADEYIIRSFGPEIASSIKRYYE